MKKSRNKKKNHNFLKYMNPKNLKKEVNRCGYNFSLKKTLQYLLMIFLGIILFSVLLKVKWQYILAIIAMVTVLYPSVILMIFRNMYEEKKFEDVTAYMEQILYSFKRRGKILIALEDARTLFFDEEKEKQGDLYEAIGRAIEHIQTGVAKGNIYQEAFAIIEEEYGCKRLYKVHDYLIQVETSGGECNEAIDILLTDRKLWMERTYALLREKKNIKTKITIGIGFSFLIIYLATMIIFIICLEWALSYWKNKPIKQMVKLMANLTGDNSISDKDIEYISDTMKQINLENQQYHRDMLNFLFFKRLDENECEFIRSKYSDFGNPFFFAAFFGERINIRILNLCMEKYGVKSQRILSPQEGECIVFFNYSKEMDIDALRETLAEVVDILKVYDVQTSTLISIPCNDVSEFYDAYQYIKQLSFY